MNTLFKRIKSNPRLYATIIAEKAINGRISDEKYVNLIFKLRNGYSLDLKNPKTYTEKLNWLKLHDRRNIYTTMVDKLLAKKYVADIIGDEYVIPLIDFYESAEDIDFAVLPNQFVLKVNHDSGGVFICRDKKQIDFNEARAFLDRRLKIDFYKYGREWPYKNVKRRILCEKYIENLADQNYKFFCFNGKVKALYVAPFREASVDYFDEDYNHLNIYTALHEYGPDIPKKPESFDKMKEIAERLSAGFPHIRVDLYEVNGKIYFGELCMFHEAGFVPFIPDRWNRVFGDWIKLPLKTEAI